MYLTHPEIPIRFGDVIDKYVKHGTHSMANRALASMENKIYEKLRTNLNLNLKLKFMR